MKLLVSSYLILFFYYSPLQAQKTSLQLLNHKLDPIIQVGLDSMAFPGAQILVRYKDSIIFHKTWGYHTYENKEHVKKQAIYDLASVTKVSSGLPILMKLYGEGKFDIDAPIKDYYSSLKKSNKKDIILRDVLAHQGQLKPYIVFWSEAIKKNGKYKWRSFKSKKSKRFPIKITDQLFLHRRYFKKMKRRIKKSKLRNKKEYKYSGLSFLLMPEMISSMVNQNFESYLYENIYQPIGITNIKYNPLNHFDKSQIIPTEYDSLWRKQLVHGTVHDEAAAMLNGISCNAGLFSDAESLSRLFQVYLNNGSWNGEEIIAPQAIKEFTSYQFENNRRGLGFDKPLRIYNADKTYIAKSASPESYGHSGFTGTMVWADPKFNFIFIFLSNRVYPNRTHRKLYQLSLRPQMHQVVYDYILTLGD